MQALEEAFHALEVQVDDNIMRQEQGVTSQANLLESRLEQYQSTLREIQTDLENDPLPTLVKLKSEDTLGRLQSQMPRVGPVLAQQ